MSFISKTDISIVSDRELITRFLGGEASCFEELVGRHEKMVYNFARMVTGNNSDAETVLAEVFVAVALNLSILESESSVSRWLMRATLDSALHIVRKRNQEFEASDDVPLNRKFISLNDTTEEKTFMLEHVIAKLPEDYQQVFLLRDMNGLTVEEISKFMSLPMEEVKERLHRARSMVGRYLKRLADALEVDLNPKVEVAERSAELWN